MSPRKRPATAVDPEAAASRAAGNLLDARSRLVVIEAGLAWASRIVLASVAGDRRNLLGLAVRDLLNHFYGLRGLEAQWLRGKQLLADAPGGRAILERAHEDLLAAVQDCGVMLGIAVGTRLRLDAEDLKGTRTGMMVDAAEVKRTAAETGLAIAAGGRHWTCDDPERTGKGREGER